jgi:hypothetical protein
MSIQESVLEICDTRSMRFRTWFEVYWASASHYSEYPDFTNLIVGSYFGHEAVVGLLLEKSAELGAKDGFGRTPIWWAVEEGHEAVVKLLLEKGAKLDSKDNYYTVVRRRSCGP